MGTVLPQSPHLTTDDWSVGRLGMEPETAVFWSKGGLSYKQVGELQEEFQQAVLNLNVSGIGADAPSVIIQEQNVYGVDPYTDIRDGPQ